MQRQIQDRIDRFLELASIRHPVLLAPMAGYCPPAVSMAVTNAGGLGACGALLFGPEQIGAWCEAFRAGSNGSFSLNLWVPDPEPLDDVVADRLMAEAMSEWGPTVDAGAALDRPIDFESQFEAILEARPRFFSTIMGLPSQSMVERLQTLGILWMATVTTVGEGLAAAAAGADVLVAQGAEAGGHRGAFDAGEAVSRAVGSFSLIPALADQVDLPIVATGGIADARTAIAALVLGASAVQIGTGFLRTPEMGLDPAWSEALRSTRPEDTSLTRGFSGRPGRAIRSKFVEAFEKGEMPEPRPYPAQRGLTAAMRKEAASSSDMERMQAWAGQSAMLSSNRGAADIVEQLAAEIRTFLSVM